MDYSANTPIALVTGVSSGIGKALASYLLKERWRVIGTARNAQDTLELETQFPDHFTSCILDLTESLVKLRDFMSNEDITLDLLINNAGIAVPGPLELISDEDFRRQMNLNLFAVRDVTNTCLPNLRKAPNPKIVNISSVSGKLNYPYNGAYCISKHALESLTDVYRRELHDFGIKVIAIEPGPIKTPIWNKNKGGLDRYFDSIYGDVLKNADKVISSSEKNAMPTSEVVKVLSRILSTDKPKPRYLLTKSKFIFRLLSDFLPDRIVDILIRKSIASGDKMRPV